MCAAVGHPVLALERVGFGPLALGERCARRSRRLRAGRGSSALRARSDTIAPMRLYALRGATSVERNDAEDDPRGDRGADARAIMERNELAPRTSSAASSRRPTTSTPSSRRSRRARSASSACRCCARARSTCRGSLPRVIRVLAHYYAPGGPRRPGTSTSARPAPARRPRCRTIGRWRSSSQSAFSGSPSIRSPAATRRTAPLVRLASNESPYPPLEAVAAASARSPTLNRYPDPANSLLRGGSAIATASRPSGSRSATAPATSCSRPARRCSSRAPSSSTRGRRSRSTRS